MAQTGKAVQPCYYLILVLTMCRDLYYLVMRLRIQPLNSRLLPIIVHSRGNIIDMGIKHKLQIIWSRSKWRKHVEGRAPSYI